MELDKISVNDYTYNLTEDRIAKYPLNRRADSRLLLYEKGEIRDDYFRNISDYLPADFLMVYNNAKVVSARLFFQKETGAKIEIFCLEPHSPADYAVAFQETKLCTWKCMVGNLKKWKKDFLSKELIVNDKKLLLSAQIISRQQNNVLIQFSWNNSKVTFGEILDNAGMVPIPPYLKRESESIDKERYQTNYSKIKGSVAAPTAGLHFDNETINKIKSEGIEIEEVTLHVGAGTFRPVQSKTVEDHEMHVEHFSVSAHTIDKLIENAGKILTVGTTTVRTLESLYWIGLKIQNNNHVTGEINLSQWEHKTLDGTMSVENSLKSIKNHLTQTNQNRLNASTQIMITPGYQFKLTSAMITNFHQPKSTLLMLIAAFVGDDWKKIYEFALNNNFRFLSYGDSSLLFPKK